MFQCAQPTMNVIESATPVKLEIVRDGDLSLDARAVFEVQEQLTPGKWTQIESLPATFATGSDRTSALLPIDDNEYISNRRLRVICWGYLSNSGGANGYLDITIQDDEPFPTITRPDLFVNEGDASPITVPFSLDKGFGRSTTLTTYGFNVTASYNDYNVKPDTLVYAHALGSGIVIYIANDALAETDETFLVEIREGALIRKQFIVTIVDDDSTQFPITFDKTSYELTEGGANNVTLTRGGITSKPSTGTLRIDTRFPSVWPAEVPVAFAAGQTSKTISLPYDDTAYGGSRVGTLQFIAPNRFIAATAPVSMTDDDPMPVVSIAAGDVIEGKSGETKHAEVMLTLSAPLSVDLFFDVVTVSGTATAGSDYTHFDKEAFFAPGQLSRKMLIPVRGDDELEPDETLRVEIRNCCDSLALIEPHSATITIRNDDDGLPPPAEPEYRLERPLNNLLNESNIWLSAIVIRSGVTNRATSVRATLSSVYSGRTFLPQDVRFRAGETRKEVRFYIDDPVYTRDGYVAALELYTGTTRQDTAYFRIDENETRPVITFGKEFVVREGNEDRGSAFVVKITPPSSKALEATLLLTGHGSGATPSSDLAGIRDGQRYTIPAGASEIAIPFRVIGDNVSEGVEEFRFSFMEVDRLEATVHGDATCTVLDDESPVAWLTVPPGIARGSTGKVTLNLRVTAHQDETFLVSTNMPDRISVPATVTVRGGDLSATFDVTGLGAGDATIDVKLSNRYLNARISDEVFVYTLITPILPERVRVPLGRSVPVTIGLSAAPEGAVQVSAASGDRAIAGVDASAALAPDGGTINIYGAAVGTTAITITLPAEFGGTTASIPVDVYAPQPGKSRAARH